MDKILIRDLHLPCIIGTGEEERRRRQRVILNLSLEADLSTAGRSDRLEDTVDYSALVKKLTDLVEGSSFRLLERLAEEVASICLGHERIVRVRVSLEKPRALPFGRSAGVEIERSRPEGR